MESDKKIEISQYFVAGLFKYLVDTADSRDMSMWGVATNLLRAGYAPNIKDLEMVFNKYVRLGFTCSPMDGLVLEVVESFPEQIRQQTIDNALANTSYTLSKTSHELLMGEYREPVAGSQEMFGYLIDHLKKSAGFHDNNSIFVRGASGGRVKNAGLEHCARS